MILSELNNLLEPACEPENSSLIHGGSNVNAFVVTDASAKGALAYADAIAIDDKYAFTKTYASTLVGQKSSLAFGYALARNSNSFYFSFSFSFYYCG